MDLEYFVGWSIYVRCNNKQKLMAKHLPAVEERIGVPDLGWEIIKEPEDPDDFRLFTFVNYQASSKDEAALCAIKLASRLYGGYWSFVGFSTLTADQSFYLMGTMNAVELSPAALALTSVQMEVEEGKITSRDKGGGWKVQRPDDEKAHALWLGM